MPGLSSSRLPLILHALPRGLTIVFFMNNLFSPHQAVCVTLQPPALQWGTAERREQPAAPVLAEPALCLPALQTGLK